MLVNNSSIWISLVIFLKIWNMSQVLHRMMMMKTMMEMEMMMMMLMVMTKVTTHKQRILGNVFGSPGRDLPKSFFCHLFLTLWKKT